MRGGIRMKLTKEGDLLIAGIDYRKEVPVVCCMTGQMQEPEYVPMEFSRPCGKNACFRKILSTLKKYGAKEKIRAVLVLPDMSEDSIRQYIQEACQAGFDRKQLKVISEAESIADFVMRQSNDIWQHRVYVLGFEPETVRAVCVRVNKRTSPMLVQVEEPESWRVGTLLEGGRDEKLAEYIGDRFSGEPVSAVFLTGTDLNAADYRKSREALCYRRRVFLAEQICARGACMSMTEEKRQYLFLSEQTLLYNVAVRSRRGGKESLYTLAEAGENWYEVHKEQEMILLGDSVLELAFQPMLGGEAIRAGMRLNDIPKRPEGATRILVELHFSGPAQCEVRVTDLGFGELYPASDLYWMDTFTLDEEEETAYGAGSDLSEPADEDRIYGGTDRTESL